MPENRAKTGRFVSGKSGNPGGRPKIPDDVKEAIRAACPGAVQYLVEVYRDPKEKTGDRLDAAKTLLDRGYGKPAQSQDISFDVNSTTDVLAQIRRVAMEQLNDE